MATLTLRPNSDSSVVLDRSTGATNYSCVDEAVKDEADYVRGGGTSNNYTTDLYGFPDHTTEGGAINSIALKCYAKRTYAGEGYQPKIKLGETTYSGSVVSVAASTTLYSQTFTKSPATTEAWTWDEIDALVAGISFRGDTYPTYVYGYQFWVEVDYTPAAFNRHDMNGGFNQLNGGMQ